MGHVLRALKKATDPAGQTNQPVVQVVTMAVTNAQKAAKAKLDATDAQPEAVAAEAAAGAASDAAVATAPPTVEAEPRRPEPAKTDSVPTPTPEPAPETAPAPTAETTAAAAETISPMILTFHKPRCEASEQIRQLRTALIRLADRGPVRCMVTSARPREGKTLTTANLALSFSEIAEKRTLLIDADLRRGRVAELMHLPAGPGLGELLAGQCAIEEVVYGTPRPNLNVIPAGQVDADQVAQLLSSETAETIIAELFRRYQHVLLDTPPAAHVADTGIIGRWVQHALLAVRIHHTPRDIVAQAAQALENAGVNVAGIVALDDRATGRGYYRYASYA